MPSRVVVISPHGVFVPFDACSKPVWNGLMAIVNTERLGEDRMTGPWRECDAAGNTNEP